MADAFESERLVYRAVEEADEAFVLSMDQDTDSYLKSNVFLPIPQGKKSAKEHREFFDKCLLAALICLPPSTSWTPSETMTPIGTVTLTDTPKERHHRNSILGIKIAREYQGRGYGTEAIRWAIDWAFRRAGLHKVCLWCFEYNSRAMRLYERMGFVPEARLREQVWHDGRFWDDCGFSLLEREWRERFTAAAHSKIPIAPVISTERITTSYNSPYAQSNGHIPQFRPVNEDRHVQQQIMQIATPISANSATTIPPPFQSRLPPPTPASAVSDTGPPKLPIPQQRTSETPALEAVPRTPRPSEPHPEFEFTTLKESTVTVAELWKEWHDGYPDEGRPSVEWMEEKHKGNWRKKQFGAPGASCQYFSQRKRIVDEVKLLVERGDCPDIPAAIQRLDERMQREGMPTLNKLANELKRDSGVQKRRRYS